MDWNTLHRILSEVGEVAVPASVIESMTMSEINSATPRRAHCLSFQEVIVNGRPWTLIETVTEDQLAN